MISNNLEQAFEALLFVSNEPLDPLHFAKTFEISEKEAKEILLKLKVDYESGSRGIVLIETQGTFQMCSNPLYYDYLKKSMGTNSRRPLSQAALETLAIVCYKQPITRAKIEEIRGVSCDHSVNRLLELGLIEEKGRADLPGKPILFQTSLTFLRHFGFSSLEEIPVV